MEKDKDMAIFAFNPLQNHYTVEDIYALPPGVRAELLDGEMFYMDSPSRKHQELVGEMFVRIHEYIREKQGECKVYISPFAVILFADAKNYVEPDVCVICDHDKLDERGCVGAPDWAIEVVSPISRQMDYKIKVLKYRTAGVREYWIIDPKKEQVTVYDFEKYTVEAFSFDKEISSAVLTGFSVKIGT